MRASLVCIFLAACASTLPPSAAPPPAEHHHELHLPPVGPTIRVAVDGKSTDVTLASLPRDDAGTARLLDLFAAGAPGVDPAPFHFDLTGSDGFHPASRPACARPLTIAEVGTARVNVVTHDVTYDPTLALPGCYRVKAVVALGASR